MTRRRRFFLVLLVVLLLLGIGGWFTFRPETIRPGMTRAEVEAILGAPDGNMLAIDGKPVEDVILVWKDRRVSISFDDNNRVREVMHPPTLLNNLRNKFGF